MKSPRGWVIGLMALGSIGSIGVQAGTLTSESLLIDGLNRTYQQFRPPPQPNQQPLPLVLVLHGAFLTANQVLDSALGEWVSLADAEGWLVVYPNGFNLAWNDCRRDTTVNQTIDDVAFLDAIIADLQAKNWIDPRRIYIAGVSNGGMMALRMAQESAYPIAAIATVLANLPANSECLMPTELPSWLLINSADDTTVPWDGGFVSGRAAQGEVQSVIASVTEWAEHLNILNGPTQWQALPDINPNDGSTVQRLTWQAPDSPAAMELYILVGSGHVTPSIQRPVAFWVELLSGRQNRDIEPALLMRDFFNRPN